MAIFGWLPSQIEQEDFAEMMAAVELHIKRQKKQKEEADYQAFLAQQFG